MSMLPMFPLFSLCCLWPSDWLSLSLSVVIHSHTNQVLRETGIPRDWGLLWLGVQLPGLCLPLCIDYTHYQLIRIPMECPHLGHRIGGRALLRKISTSNDFECSGKQSVSISRFHAYAYQRYLLPIVLRPQRMQSFSDNFPSFYELCRVEWYLNKSPES